MHFRYLAYGLAIDSALELAELGDADAFADQPDVIIRLGVIAQSELPRGAGRVRSDWIDHQHFRFRDEDGTHFAVNDGREIIVMPGPSFDAATMRLYLLGSVCGALLLQRGFLVLHGNAIRVGEHCLVCVGETGAGKSTLAAAFLKRGFDVLADDVVAVDRHGCAVPSFPRMKLWRDAADHLGMSTDGLTRVMLDMEKYNLPIPGHDPSIRAPIRWIYALSSADIDEVRIDPVPGMQRLDLLQFNTYRSRYVHGELLPRHFEQCSRLAARIHIAKVVRPSRGYPPDSLVDILLEDMAAYSH